jgi:hypothetical protein
MWHHVDLEFTQYLHGATSQKMAFFIVNAVKTSNLTSTILFLMNPKVHHCDGNSLSMDHIQRQYNQVPIITPYFSKTCLSYGLIP